MKKLILNLVSNGLFAVALLAATTPSQMGLYQPECPKSMGKYTK